MKLKPFTREERIERIKQYLPIFLLGVLGILSAIALNLYLIVTDQYIDWISSLLAFIPGLFLLLLWRFGKTLPEKKWKQTMLGVFSSGCLTTILIVGFSTWYHYSIWNAESTIYYSTFYRLNKEVFQEKYNHFPEKIPQNAKDAKFHFDHWLGEGRLTLEYKTTLEELQEIEEKYRSQSICILDEGKEGYSLSEIQKKCGWNFDLYWGIGGNSLETFEIFALNVFFEQSASGSEHCDATGIAIDETNSVIIYWYESYWCPKDGLNYPLYP